MKVRLAYRFSAVVGALCLGFALQSVEAATVTNWHTFRATTATTLSGQGTGNPVMGSTNLPSVQGFLVGYFDPVSLTNVGDRVTLSYQVSFTDATNMVNAQDNFRFGLFDVNGQTLATADNTATAGVVGQTDDWRGYWFGVKHPTGVGSIRERIAKLNSGANIFAATGTNSGTAPSLLTAGLLEGAINFQSSTNPAGGPVYSAQMIVEKTSDGIALGGFFIGNGGSNLFRAKDINSPSPVNYGAVGVLNGGLDCDQVNFQNVTATYSAYLPAQVTSDPTNVTVIAGQPATFRVSWTNGPAFPSIQWRENGSDIPNATNTTYTITNTLVGQDQNLYTAVIFNTVGAETVSAGARLTVINDTTPPTALSASSFVSNVVNVIYSEFMDESTVQDPGNYTLAGNSISSITLIGRTNAQLTLDNPIATSNYTLTVQNVKDFGGNSIATTNIAGIAHGFKESVSFLISDGLAYAYNDKMVIHASGTDLFGTGDQGQFVHKPVSGDFDLAVKVESLLNTDANAKAGIMARVSTFFDSRNVMIEATPGRFIFQVRTNDGEASLAFASPRPPTAFPNCWVRLVRSGAVFTGYSSTNAGVWDLVGSFDTSIGSAGAYPSEISIGLAATSHTTNSVTKAVFSGFGASLVTPKLSVTRGVNDVQLTWPVSAIGFNLQATPSLSSPITWTNVPGSSVTNQANMPVNSNALFFRLSK